MWPETPTSADRRRTRARQPPSKGYRLGYKCKVELDPELSQTLVEALCEDLDPRVLVGDFQAISDTRGQAVELAIEAVSDRPICRRHLDIRAPGRIGGRISWIGRRRSPHRSRRRCGHWCRRRCGHFDVDGHRLDGGCPLLPLPAGRQGQQSQCQQRYHQRPVACRPRPHRDTPKRAPTRSSRELNPPVP